MAHRQVCFLLIQKTGTVQGQWLDKWAGLKRQRDAKHPSTICPLASRKTSLLPNWEFWRRTWSSKSLQWLTNSTSKWRAHLSMCRLLLNLAVSLIRTISTLIKLTKTTISILRECPSSFKQVIRLLARFLSKANNSCLLNNNNHHQCGRRKILTSKCNSNCRFPKRKYCLKSIKNNRINLWTIGGQIWHHSLNTWRTPESSGSPSLVIS
jgi:hypothetical protein